MIKFTTSSTTEYYARRSSKSDVNIVKKAVIHKILSSGDLCVSYNSYVGVIVAMNALAVHFSRQFLAIINVANDIGLSENLQFFYCDQLR